LSGGASDRPEAVHVAREEVEFRACCLLAERQTEDERGPSTGLTADRKGSAQAQRELARHEEPEPSPDARATAAGLGAVAAVKDAALLLRRDARALVLDTDHRVGLVGLRGERDRATAIADRVVQQVRQDGPDESRIRRDRE